MSMASHSLQRRLLLLVLGLVCSVCLLTTALAWWDTRNALDELLDAHLAQAAAILVVQQAQDMEAEGPGVDAPSLHRYAPKVAFQVFHNGQLSLRSSNAPADALRGKAGEFRAGFQTVQVGAEDWRVFAAYGAERDVQVYVGEAAASRRSILRAVLLSTFWPMLLGLPLLALALWWAVRRSLKPVREFGAELSRRQPDAQQSLPAHGLPAEMVPLAQALNGLLGRIGTLRESERRFTADASHELRTPIAAIRAQAQVALAESDEGLRLQALRNTLAGCDRASHLIDQLLTLSRLEAVAAPAREMLDLNEHIRQAVGELAPQAIAKGQKLVFDGTPGCRLPANTALLSVLVRNLIDNAIRYCPPQADIRVALRMQNQHPVLSVDDSGPGLSEADISRLGERFFRVPGSAADGSGLGWSIVRRIAAVHGLQVQVTRSDTLGGLRISIEPQVTT